MSLADRSPDPAAETSATEGRPTLGVRRILCVTDLTSRSDGAMERARLLSQEHGADLLFVHAVSEVRAGRVLRMKVARAQSRLLSLAERAVRDGTPHADALVRLGGPLEVIQEAAQSWEPDLIVMARPSRQRLDTFFGTTAERVIRATRCPVLLIARQTQEPYRNVVLATDLSKNSAHVARVAAAMGVLTEARTWVVHAFTPPYYGLLANGVEEQIAVHKQHWRSVLSRNLVQDVSAGGVDPGRVEIVVEPARPCDVIEESVRTSGSELLVIGTSRWIMLKRILFASITDQMFRRLSCDILAIPPLVKPRVRAAVSADVPVQRQPRVAANVATVDTRQ